MTDLQRSSPRTAWVPGKVIFATDLPTPTATQLAYYCAATGIVDPIHYDRDFAATAGFAGLVVNGSLRAGWALEAISAVASMARWRVVSASVQHRAVLLVGEPVRVEVVCDAVDAGQATVRCVLTSNGRETDVGTGRFVPARRRDEQSCPV